MSPQTTQHVYLAPGFFGFTSLGTLNYFLGVTEQLQQRLADHGVKAVIHEIPTMPTGSIRQRAVRLMEKVEATGGLQGAGLHFVGHSTGGLDARLLVTPGVELVPTEVEEAMGKHTRTVQTLSTPHHGTPLANFFTTLQGRNVLYALTLLATTTPGRLGVSAMAQIMSLVARFDDYVGQKDTILDHFAEQLLRSVSPDRGHKLWEFLHEVSQDQGAVIQLTPESVDLFNAAVSNRAGVRYFCHVSTSPAPRLRHALSSLTSFYAPIGIAMYALVYRITSREHRSYPYPAPGDEVREIIEAHLPYRVTAASNDGIVPTLSQVWGEVGQVAEGDHLDVVGQYRRELSGQSYPGWLESGAGFTDRDFEALWDGIAQVIADAS